MEHIQNTISADIAAVGKIAVVPTILEVVCRTTGMGFAAVARVTDKQWIACSVLDEIKFGLLPGGELKLESTICHEIRQSGNAVIIDHVEKDEAYALHHTPAMYGFQSYISVPIIAQEGSFFGTLCAIDPRPTILNTPEIVGMFKLYADLISLHLAAQEQLASPQIKRIEDMIAVELKAHLSDVLTLVKEQDTPDRVLLDKRSTQFISLIKGASERLKVLVDSLKDFVSAERKKNS